MSRLSDLFTREWYCVVFLSGQHNGVYCDPGDSHFGCGYRWTAPALTDAEAKEYGFNPPLDLKVGNEIRYTRFCSGARVGGAEPKYVQAVTEEWIIYKCYSARGKNLGEHVITHADFRENWEKGKADAPR